MAYGYEIRRKNLPSQNRHKRRRLFSLIDTITASLGGICFVISGLFALCAWLLGLELRGRMLFFCLIYITLGLIMFGLRFAAKKVKQALRDKKLYENQPPTQPSTQTVQKKSDRSATKPAAIKSYATSTSSSNDGAALIFVLLVISLIVSLVIQAQVSTHRSLKYERRALHTVHLRTRAEDAALQAMHLLARDSNLRIDATNEPWASPQEFDQAEISTVVRITDENRFFDLNNLSVPEQESRTPAQIIMDIMTLCGDYTPLDRIESLRSWMDEDDEGYAESYYYLKQDPPYRAANRNLQSWNELLAVKGFTKDFLTKPKRHSLHGDASGELLETLTIIPIERQSPVVVKVNTAGRDVLLGLFGFEYEEIVRAIVMMRQIRPIASLDELLPLAGDPKYFEQLRPYLDVKSRYFRIDARAYGNHQAEQLRVLVRRDEEGEVDVLQWVF